MVKHVRDREFFLPYLQRIHAVWQTTRRTDGHRFSSDRKPSVEVTPGDMIMLAKHNRLPRNAEQFLPYLERIHGIWVQHRSQPRQTFGASNDVAHPS